MPAPHGPAAAVVPGSARRVPDTSFGWHAMRSLKVVDYMADHLVTFTARTSVVEAITAFIDHRISGAPVVDDEGRLIGMLSELDVLTVMIQDSYYNERHGIVGDCMRAPVDTVDAETDIFTLAERFVSERRRRFPVVRDGRLVGQISRRDVLRAARDLMELDQA